MTPQITWDEPTGAAPVKWDDEPQQSAQISARRDSFLNWLEDLQNDIRTGTGETLPGRILKKLGAPGIETGTSPAVSKIIAGPVIGPPTLAHGVLQAAEASSPQWTDQGTVAPPLEHPVKQTMRGLNEAVSGAMETAAPLMIANPELLPTVARYALLQKGVEKGAQALGADPDTAEFAGNVAMLGGGALESKLGTLKLRGTAPEPADIKWDAKPTNATPSPLANLVSDESGSLDATRAAEGVTNFATQDVIPKAKDAVTWAGRAKDEVLNTLAPRVGVPEKALNSVMDMMGAREESIAETQLRGEEARKVFDKMPEEEQIAFLDKFKRGEEQPTPELQDIAARYHAEGDADYRAVIEQQLTDDPMWKKMTPEQKDTFLAGVKSDAIDENTPALKELSEGLLNYKENHLRSFWETLPGEEEAPGTTGLGRAPLQGTKGFFKQATLPDVSTGIEQGGKLVTTNPQALFEMGRADTMKWISTQRMIAQLKQNGFMQFLQKGQRMPDGFTDLNDNLAKVQFPAKSGEGMVSPGKWVIEKNTGRILNNFLGPDTIRQSAIGGGLLKVKNAATGTELAVNSFHWVNEAMSAVDTDLGVGFRKIATGDLAAGGKDVLGALASPYKTARLGGSALRYIKDPEGFLKTTRGADFIEKFPEAKQAISDLFAAGGKLRMHEDYRAGFIDSMKKAAKENNPIGAVLRSPMAAAEYIAKPLFDVYIPRLKVGAFLKDYGQLLQERAGDLATGKVTRNVLARQAWDRTEHIFGELNWDKLFLNRNFKTATQFVFRSATWQYGNAAELANAIGGTRQVFKGKLDADTAWGLGTLTRTAIMGALATKIMTGKWPTQLADFFYPKTGGVDRRGKPNRMSMPGYVNTDYRLLTTPDKSISGALSTPLTRGYDVARNKDWRGQEIYDPSAGKLSQAGDIADYLTPKPFSYTNWQRAKDTSGSTWQGLRGGLGFNNAPYDLDTTPAERLAREIVTQKIPTVRTPEQVANSELRGRLATEARNGDEAFKQDLVNAIRGEKITQRQALQLAGTPKQSYLQGLVRHLGVEDTLRVWDVASPAERADLKPLLIQKATGASFANLPPSKQKELATQIREAVSSSRRGALKIGGQK